MTNLRRIFIVVAGGLAATYGWFSDKSKALKEDEFNRALKQQLEEERLQLDHKAEHLADLNREFESGYLRGRKWLARLIGEADKARDDVRISRQRDR